MASGYVKPPALRAGDRVAVVSSSWGGPSVLPAPHEAGLGILRDHLGLEVVEARTARMPADELAGAPRLRAETMNELFADDSIRAIISTIGGDDSVRILPWLDTDLAVANPKIVLGYSDTDAQLVAYHLAGLVTYNGPSVMSGFAQLGTFGDALEHARAMLLGEAGAGYELPEFERWTETNSDWADPKRAAEVVGLRPHDGWHWLGAARTTRGRLFGGCIEVLEFLKGTRWWPNADPSWWRDRVLFLETSEEKPSLASVRYWLRNYGSQGAFDQLAALWFGRARSYSDDEKTQLDASIVDVVVGEFGATDLPIVTNLDFGHTDPQWVLPLGVEVETDPLGRTLRLGEAPTA
ncbi:LD-carboxypeptidase [Nocardioidaceae bacterium SCSIO 66511]|nr:LD-carboxypeptidase [Nocardioidaceae bacterium SCSIO 66511]